MRGQGGETAFSVPFLAMVFHAIGLNAMHPSESKRDVLETSTMAVRDMVVMLQDKTNSSS